MILQSIRIPCTFKPVKTRNVKRQIKCSSGSDYSEQTFDDVDTVLIKYFTFRSTQYTLGQVYEMDMSPMKSEFNWLCDFSNEHNTSSGDALIEALYENGKTNIASPTIDNRYGLLKRWLSHTTQQNGEQQRLKTHNKHMNISRSL